jgi:hypothetical protein
LKRLPPEKLAILPPASRVLMDYKDYKDYKDYQDYKD